MDPSVLLQSLLHLWYFIPLVLLLTVLRSPWLKGHLGEFIVNVSARLFLDRGNCHLIQNVTLPSEDGTTPIDHIIVSRYGVFVVETKNIEGWIFGTAEQRRWSQKINLHSQKFQNPLQKKQRLQIKNQGLPYLHNGLNRLKEPELEDQRPVNFLLDGFFRSSPVTYWLWRGSLSRGFSFLLKNIEFNFLYYLHSKGSIKRGFYE